MMSETHYLRQRRRQRCRDFLYFAALYATAWAIAGGVIFAARWWVLP